MCETDFKAGDSPSTLYFGSLIGLLKKGINVSKGTLVFLLRWDKTQQIPVFDLADSRYQPAEFVVVETLDGGRVRVAQSLIDGATDTWNRFEGAMYLGQDGGWQQCPVEGEINQVVGRHVSEPAGLGIDNGCVYFHIIPQIEQSPFCSDCDLEQQ